MTQKRCDVCRLKADLDPRNLYDVLCYLSPPLDLLAAIDRWVEAAPARVPQSIKDYREKWRKLMAGDPMPPIDRLNKPVQGVLIDTGRKVHYD